MTSLERFNPRPRAGGKEEESGRWWEIMKFQSTPPRGGQVAMFAWFVLHLLFQSTPPRGGQGPAQGHRRHSASFNPRPRAGGKLVITVCRPYSDVSIHAPARGARPSTTPSHTPPSFQSTPPRGGQAMTAEIVRNTMQFQSTPPRGGQDGRVRMGSGGGSFNPRPRAGGKAKPLSKQLMRRLVSIHAPARGASPSF